mmetsp:Transcript_18439/g.69773  ORF Transcript_18439/g.69773 Transcript_18439/m.69773 type:complete len:394 (-) Transcript_18439:86-1267(-)
MLLVLLPVVAVLDAAHVVVPIGAVHQEDAEVDGVEVRDDVLGAAEKAPREAHEPVACVVDLPCHAPPATDEKLPAPLRRQRLEVRNLRTAGIPSKRVLLAICSAEDRVAHHLEQNYCGQRIGRQLRVAIYQVSRLQRVGERHPGEVAEGQHEPKAVRGDVHRRQNRPLVVLGVPDVQPLKHIDEDHGRGDVSEPLILLERAAQIEHRPSDQAWPKLAKLLEIKIANARVQLAADEEVVDHIVRLASLGELLRGLQERGHVEVQAQAEADQQRRRQKAQIFIVQLRQGQRPEAAHAQTLRRQLHCAKCQDRRGDPELEMGAEAVLQPQSVLLLQRCAQRRLIGKYTFQEHAEADPVDGEFHAARAEQSTNILEAIQHGSRAFRRQSAVFLAAEE